MVPKHPFSNEEAERTLSQMGLSRARSPRANQTLAKAVDVSLILSTFVGHSVFCSCI
jgi:hypothetical protein